MASKNWIVPVLVGLSLAGAPAAAYAQDKITPEARAYFKNGVELLQSEPPNYQDAYYQFKLAYEKSQSWKVLGNLGLCAVKLERDGEALAFYDDYLKRGGKQINKEEREAIERDMLLIKGNGATLELTSKVEELKIQDSRSGSAAAPQTHELSGGKKSIFVRAGSHKLTATATDGRSLTWEVSVEPNTTLTHDFDFDAPVTPPVAATPPIAQPLPPPPPPEAPPPRSNPLTTVGFITGGVGIAVLGAGVVTGIMAKGKESDAKDKCNAEKVCAPEAEKMFEDASNLAKTTNILLISGGVLTAAGVGMAIVGLTSKPKQEQAVASRQLVLVPVLSANAGGIFASGTF